MALVATLTVLLVPVVVLRLLGVDAGYPLPAVLTVFPWIVALLVAVAGGGLALGARRLAATAGVAALLGATVLVPRALPGPAPAEAPTGPVRTIAVANLRLGEADADAVVAAVREHDVDVLLTLELTEPAIARLDAAGLGSLLPEVALLPSGLTSGGGIHARDPLTPLAPSDARRFGATPRAALDVAGAPRVVVEGVHPLPPIDPGWTRDWRAALTALPAPAIGAADDVVLLAGDLNATHDHAPFRALLDAGWVDAADARGRGLVPTFHGLPWGEPVPPVALDHVLVDRRVAVEAVTTAPLPGSDHRILVVRLRLPAG
ncbi:MAG: endonuclease/exonuclease/phosphatase family protein [Actinomycetes bacterium]